MKSAVKESLVDTTERFELIQRQNPHLLIQERVEMFVTIAGMSDELPVCKHWESMFFFLILRDVCVKLKTINHKEYVPIIAELTATWINRVLGGNAKNMYDEIKLLGWII